MNPYQTAQNRLNQLVGIKPTNTKNTFKNTDMYYYIMAQRIPSIGTHPTEGFVNSKEIHFRNRVAYLLGYSKELTPEEVIRFELTPHYLLNEPAPYTFTFAGDEVIEMPKATGLNEITSFVDGEEYDKYSFSGWFKRVNS